MKGYVECLLQVTGDAAGLNTFDKLFRSGKGPSWADRASDGAVPGAGGYSAPGI